MSEKPRYIDLDKAIPVAIQACVDVIGHGISQIDAVNIACAFEEMAVDLSKVEMPTTLDKETWKLKNEIYAEISKVHHYLF